MSYSSELNQIRFNLITSKVPHLGGIFYLGKNASEMARAYAEQLPTMRALNPSYTRSTINSADNPLDILAEFKHLGWDHFDRGTP